MADREPVSAEAIQELRRALEAESPAFREASKTTRNADMLIQAARTNLRQERLRRNMDQADLAAALDMTQSAISKFETGTGDIGIKNLTRVAAGLEMVPLVLFVSKWHLAEAKHNPRIVLDILFNVQEQVNSQVSNLLLNE